MHADPVRTDGGATYEPPSAARRRGLLSVLLAAVVAARETERIQRHLSATAANSNALAQAHDSTLQALLAYADAIDELNWPVPRSIQADIQMHRVIRGQRMVP